MAKRVFFSFHYHDVAEFRANVVRNHWMTKPDREEAGYFDASIWESAKKQGDQQLKRLINDGLEATSNTCVLIGTGTHERRWVRYELFKSFLRGNHIFGVHINGIRCRNGLMKAAGPNPLEYVGVSYAANGKSGTMWEKVNGQWHEYTEIGGRSEFTCSVDAPFCGRGYNFFNFFPVYDWVANSGYQNFSTWVK